MRFTSKINSIFARNSSIHEKPCRFAFILHKNCLKIRIKRFLQRRRILKDCSLADLFGLKHNIKAICKSHYQDLHIAFSVFYSQIKLPIKLLFLISLFVDVGKLCNIAISYIKAMFYFAEIVSRRMLIYGNKEYKIKS